MKNYSRKFRRNYRGGIWPFDGEASSEPSLVQKTEDKAKEAYNKVTSMFSSDDSTQSGGKRIRRRQSNRRRSRNRRR